MKTFLMKLIETGGNMVMFGRSLQVRHPDLYQWVIDSTQFLPDDCTFNERVYCILNDLTDRPRCPLSGLELRFKNFFAGYRNVSQKAQEASIEGSTGLTGKDIETLRQNANEHFCRSMRVSNPELYKRILYETRDLGTDRMSERVYCILNGFKERPPGKFVSLEAGYNNGRRRELVHDENARNAALVGSTDLKVGAKVTKYLQRNKRHNAHLYDLPESERGKSFVVCPVLGTRMLNIKRPYVEGVLQMSWEEFLRRYPDVQLTCSGHSEKIGKGLQEEVEPGLSKHALSVKKARVTKKTVGMDGLTVDQRKGRKTRETHLNKVDENGLNGYQRIAKVARPKQIDAMAKKGLRAPRDKANAWNAYRNFVHWLSKPLKTELLGDRPTGRAGTLGAYQIDHLYPIVRAFSEGVSPWLIAHEANLNAIPWEENAKKNAEPGISLEELMCRADYTEERSRNEFEKFMKAFKCVEGKDFGSATIHEEVNKLLYGSECCVEQPVRDSNSARLGRVSGSDTEQCSSPRI